MQNEDGLGLLLGLKIILILFVLHEWFYCLGDVVVEANVVFA